MKMLVLSTENRYNISVRKVFAEPVLIVRFVQHAKRYKKIIYFRRRIQPNALWRHPLNPCILQKSQTQVAFANLCEVSSTFQPLSSCRANLGHYLCNNCWHLPLEQDQNLTRQQLLPADNRLKEFSLCQQLEALPEAGRFQGNSGYQQGARPAKSEDISSQTPHKPLVRPGFFRSYHLWKVHRRSQSGLQPSQKGQAFLPSPALFRIPHKRLLAWGLKAWRCLYCIWLCRVLERMSCQASTSSLPHTLKSRLGLLRPQVHRTSKTRKELVTPL